MKVSLLRVAAGISIFAACTMVLGSIPPSEFHFQTIVAPDKDTPSGWRAAQVLITLGSRYGAVVCQVEVGVPFITGRGSISEEYAQVAAATAADEAARVVLEDPTATMSATLCIAFLEEMRVRLKNDLPGVRVSRFKTAGLTPSHWP